MENAWKRLGVVLALLLAFGLLFLMPLYLVEALPGLPYAQLLEDIAQDKVRQAVFAGRTVTVTYQDGDMKQVYLPENRESLLELLASQQVMVEFVKGGGPLGWALVLSWAVTLTFLAAMVWVIRGGPGQAISFGDSQAQCHQSAPGDVSLQDVAGMPEVKEELAEVVDYLRNPQRYRELGARIPRGVLLWGPPGTGKTLLARAIAGEAGVSFISTPGPQFVEMFAGVGASRVRDLFKKARRKAPSIVFIDEIDALGGRRGRSISGAAQEREQALNQLLVEMDGFRADDGVVVMAATNRVDVLDPALLRPGRFDRQIAVDLPDWVERTAILQVHAAGKPMAPQVDLERVARLTIGFTGADLANLLNESALLAARRRKECIGEDEIHDAFERLVTGSPPQRRVLSRRERLRIAIHESGHALVSRQLPESDPVQKVSILPRGRALGYVLYRAEEERHLETPSRLMSQIVTLLAGHAAEAHMLGEVTSGVADDLEKATQLAQRLVAYREMAPDGALVSEDMAVQTDQAVRELIAKAYGQAEELVRRQRAQINALVHLLLAQESVSGQELEAIMDTENSQIPC